MLRRAGRAVLLCVSAWALGTVLGLLGERLGLTPGQTLWVSVPLGLGLGAWYWPREKGLPQPPDEG